MGSLLFSPSGRIGPNGLMKGALILSILLFVIKALPLVSLSVAGIVSIVGLVLIYCWFAIFIKRLHDAGKSGWLSILPVAIIVLVGMFFVEAFVQNMVAPELVADLERMATEAAESGDLGAIFGMMSSPEAEALATKVALPVAAARAAFSMLVAFLFNMIFKQDPGDNQFGPVPAA